MAIEFNPRVANVEELRRVMFGQGRSEASRNHRTRNSLQTDTQATALGNAAPTNPSHPPPQVAIPMPISTAAMFARSRHFGAGGLRPRRFIDGLLQTGPHEK